MPELAPPNAIAEAIRQAALQDNQWNGMGHAAEAERMGKLGYIPFMKQRGDTPTSNVIGWRFPYPLPEEEAASAAKQKAYLDANPPMSGPNGYNPIGDIVELRGTQRWQGSGYGVTQPSNYDIGQHKGRQALLGVEQQKAGAMATSAGADATRAKAATDELAWKQSPEGQKFARDMAVVNNTQNPASDPYVGPNIVKVPPTPPQQVGTALGVPPGMPPPATFDQAVKQHIDQGGGPIAPDDPLYGAFQKQYGADMNSRLGGKPIGWTESMASSPIGMLGGLMRGLGVNPGQRSADAKRIFARVAPMGPVGVKTSRPRMASGITQAIDGLEQK